MGKLFFCEVCMLSCALMLMHIAAEPLFFRISNTATWDEARHRCQRCFKDLVAVNPNNTNIISQNLTSDYWIGLRRAGSQSNNYTSNSSVAWTRWANGDPLAFQNWYPGWPVFKSPVPKINCCSCSCTCPQATSPTLTPATSSFTRYTSPDVSSFSDAYQNTSDFANVSAPNTAGAPGATLSAPRLSLPTVSATVSAAASLPVTAACEKSPTPMPDVPDPNENYVEDSCVAMLSSGPWVERNCTELLPYICYEDRFIGGVTVDKVTASGALLTWLPGPTGISHYRLEVNDSFGHPLVVGKNVSLNLSYSLDNLTAGYSYTVIVSSVKCDRDIDNPQKTSFYTIPNKVVNPNITMQTTVSITLSWSQPTGNVDFYRVQYNNTEIKTNSPGITVNSLTPGSWYIFSICSGVNDSSKWSDASIVAAYTKPGSVSNLLVSDDPSQGDGTGLMLSWSPPPGLVTDYRVVAMNNSNFFLNSSSVNQLTVFHPNSELNNTVVTQSPLTVYGLPAGTKITFKVTARAGGLEGDTVNVTGFTASEPVSNLFLTSSADNINASWTRSADSSFNVTLTLDNGVVIRSILSNESIVFTGLKNAANYTVTVISFSGDSTSGRPSNPVSRSIFTLPLPPINANTLSKTSSQITFTWTPPQNTKTNNYSVQLYSNFWKQTWLAYENTSTHTFSGLKSGTKYQFEVRTVVDGRYSSAVTLTQYTDSKPVQITLSMLCSSAQSLLCADSTTMAGVFQKLNNTMNGILGDDVLWSLSKQTSENLAP